MPGTTSSRTWLVGFLILLLGFLRAAALAAPLDEALGRLGRLETQRAQLLSEADSLGGRLEALPSDQGEGAKAILRQAERLAKRSTDVDVEILLAREACRTLAQQELEALRARSGRVTTDAAREDFVLGILGERLADRIGDELVLVQPDSLDGYETLLDKQAYLQDLRDRVVTLDRRLDERAKRLRRERAVREASAGFTDEARFLDEGGRVGSDDLVRLRGGPAADGGGDGTARIAPAAGDGATAGEGDANLAPPLDSQPPADPIRTLAQARARLAQDLSLVSTALDSTRRMLGRFNVEAP